MVYIHVFRLSDYCQIQFLLAMDVYIQGDMFELKRVFYEKMTVGEMNGNE